MAKILSTDCMSCITGVYKAIENSNLTPEKNQDQSDNELRHSHISLAEFGLDNKNTEINFALMSENKIPGNRNRLSQNHFIIDNRKGTKSGQDLSEPSKESFYNSSATDQVYRFPLIHYTGGGKI